MSDPHAERLFAPVEPADRPRKQRRTVRVILVDSRERTLLFCDSDPGVPGVRWWVTPGGGMDPGESEAQTAVREVAEETGAIITEAELLGPVARRHVVHGYSDQVIEQDETFYVARVEPFEVDVSAHTEEEQLTILAHRWWSLDDLRTTTADIWPSVLPQLWELIDFPERWPWELGTQEESTVSDAR